MNNPEQRLPKELLDKAVHQHNEYGWKREDILDVVEAARRVPLAVISGQIQYLFHDATCELHWLEFASYKRLSNENWLSYCNRCARECTTQIESLLLLDIEQEAITFDILRQKRAQGVNLEDHLIFITYFDDVGYAT